LQNVTYKCCSSPGYPVYPTGSTPYPSDATTAQWAAGPPKGEKIRKVIIHITVVIFTLIDKIFIHWYQKAIFSNFFISKWLILMIN